MPTTETHTIQTAKLQLHFANRDQAYDRQTEVLNVFKEKVLPELEQEFERFAIPGQVIRLDQLKLNIGNLLPQNLGKSFEEKVIQELRVQLRREVEKAKKALAGGDIQPIVLQRVDQLISFIRLGRLGWEQKAGEFDPVKWMDQVLKEAPEAFQLRLKASLSYQGVAARIVRQFRSDQVDQILDLLRPGLGSLMPELIRSLQAVPVLNTLFDLRGRKPLQFVHEYIFSLAVGPQTLFHGMVQELGLRKDTRIHEQVRSSIPQSISIPLLSTGVLWGLLRNQGGFKSIPVDGADPVPVLERLLPGLLSEVSPDPILRLAAKDPDFANTLLKAIGDSIALPAPPAIGRVLEVAVGNLEEGDRRKEIGEELEVFLELPLEEEAIEDQPLKKVKAEEEYVFLEQAGLVLLNPFLPTLFERMGWVENEAFVGTAERESAVHLLGYLATGRTNLNEAELVLEKLMCGMELEDPLDTVVSFEQTQLDEAEDLLRSAIGYWEKLGKVSPEEFRDTFLAREGKLTPTGDGWHLKIERRSFDILLQFIPWGYGIIRFPWMAKMLHVDW